MIIFYILTIYSVDFHGIKKGGRRIAEGEVHMLFNNNPLVFSP